MIKKSMTLMFSLACIFLILAGQAFADSTLKFGDLNGDKKINSTDYSLLKRYVMSAEGFTPLQITASDLNADGNVNSTDVSLLKRKILRMIDSFPAEQSQANAFLGIVKSLRIEGQAIVLERDVEGVSTEVLYPVKTDSDDLKEMNNSWNNTSGSAISWTAFLRDQENVAGDKTGFDSLSAEKRIYKFTTNSSNQIIKIQRLSFGNVGSVPENLAGEGMTYAVTNFDRDNDYIEIADNLNPSLNKNLWIVGTVFFDLKAGKVVYWKDIEGQNSLESKIAWSLKSNGNLDAVAFLDDTYKNVTKQNYEYYKYVMSETYDGQCYNLGIYGETSVKLYKDNMTSDELKQLADDFIGYVKDGEGIKIKLAVAPSYTTSAGIGIRVIKNEDENFKPVCGKFVKKDGATIVVDGESYVLSDDAKAAKIGFKSSGQIDNRAIVNIEDISPGNNVALVLADNKVRAIFSLR